MHWWKLETLEQRRFFLLFGGGLLYVLPILLADRYYQDDLARSLYGATGWSGDGRPLTNWLMQLLAGGRETITDLAPLPILLGLAALSYALTLYARQTLPGLRGSTAATLTLGLVLAHPFAMQNLSYKFDSFTMLLALSICIALYALPAFLSRWKLALAGAIASLVVMGLYQPASGMFLVLAGVWLTFWLLDWLGNGTPIRERLPSFWTEVWRLGGVGAGALFYLLVLVPRLVDPVGWRQEASQTVSGPSTAATLVTNILSAAYYIRERMRQTPPLYRVILFITVLGAVSTAVWQFWRSSKGGLFQKLAGCIVLVGAPVGLLLASYLPLVFLQNMGCSPRMFLAYGGAMLFIGLLWLRAAQSRRITAMLGGVLVGLCLFCQTCYMYAYGTALKSQKAYEVYLVGQIVHDCEVLNQDHTYKQLSFIGTAPRPQQVQMICSQYPYFNELILNNFDNSTWIGGAWVYHYMQYDLEITNITPEDEIACASSAPLAANARYGCYENGDKLIIVFR